MSEQYPGSSQPGDWQPATQPVAQGYAPQYPPAVPYGAVAGPPAYGYPIVVQQAPSNGLGTAGFVTGLLGLIFCWVFVFGLILGLLGVILGGVGISTGHKKGAGTGLAIAGLVLGLISLVPSIIIMAAVSSVSSVSG